MIKEFLKKIYNSVIFKRITAFFLCFLVAVMLCFASIPSKVRADIFTAVSLGTSALGALVSAYLATAGVQFSGSGSTDGDFLGNYISNWVKNSSSFSSNPYFNNSGEFIGSSDDVSVVQNNETNVVSLIFGKEFAAWLEVLKQSFVSDNSLSSSTDTSLVSDSFVTDTSGVSYPVIQAERNNFSTQVYDNYSAIMPLEVGSSKDFSFTSEDGQTVNTFSVTVTRVALYNARNNYADFDLVVNGASSSIRVGVGNLNFPCKLVFVQNPNSAITFGIARRLDLPQFQGLIFSLNLSDVVTSDITLDGTLSDGYQDFEDAINQDLTNADDENVAVVDVGSFPDSLTADQIADIILDRIIADDLNPTYEGIRENMQDAEEEQEGTRPFIPQYPSDWVIIHGIENFFPFCIPWDLAFVFNLLQAEPEAPRFTWRMSFGKYVNPYDLVIDFSQFETVAVVFRTMMVVLFLFFIIKKTRGLIRG